MELRHLRYFITVAEELNFTRAAQRLHIGQPPLSMQIRDLEIELGATLFHRTKRRVQLTPAGERFLLRAQHILIKAEEAKQEIQSFSKGELGELRIGFASSLPYSLTLPRLLDTFRKLYPQVSLQLSEHFTNEQIEKLDHNTLDVGFIRHINHPLPEGLAMKEIGRDPLRLVINADNPLAQVADIHMQDLQHETFITFPPGVGSGLPTLLDTLAHQAGFTPHIGQQAKEATTQIGLVAAGLSVAILPAPLECIQLPRVRFLPINNPLAFYALFVAWRQQDNNPLTNNFLNILSTIQMAQPEN